MRVLQIHTFYVSPGGEDAVASAEAALLRSHSHEVLEYQASNVEALSGGLLATTREKEVCRDRPECNHQIISQHHGPDYRGPPENDQARYETGR